MRAKAVFSTALAAPAVLSKQKSFSGNPVIGSRALNERGLHRRRVALSHAMSWRRRAALAKRLRPEEREAFDRDGFVVRENALPADLLARLTEELASVPRAAWEMRQGHAVTRLMPLPVGDGSAAAQARRWLSSPQMRALVGYVAGRSGHYNPSIQTIATCPDPSKPDPQNTLHADTFHPTAKFWLFLHDVAADEGPFSYVAGSHRLTPERLAFEHEQSLIATSDANVHHASGSFRIDEGELATLGYGGLTTLPVRGNTLVVADTFGFHRRTPSTKPTVRTELHGMVRRNPFVPWNGLDPARLPLVRDYAHWWLFASRDLQARRGRPSKYRNVGRILAAAPALPDDRHD